MTRHPLLKVRSVENLSLSGTIMTQADPKRSTKGGWMFRPTVEPIMMVFAYLIAVSSAPMTDLVMRQCCRQLNLDPANCSNDESTKEEIHRMSSSVSMWRIIIDTLPGCVMSLFTSPWSDTNGRKPVLIISSIGCAMSQATMSYMSTLPDIHPYYLLASGIPFFFTGGPILMVLNSFCYLIDITNIENRTIRLAVMMQAGSIASLIAQFAAPPLEDLGYDWVFAINTILLLFVTVYIITLLPESVNVVEEKRKKLFTIDHLVDSFKTFFKNRPNHARGILFCLLVASCCLLAILAGEPDVKYLSLIKKFDWEIRDYSDYTAVGLVLTALAVLSGVYFGLNILKLSELMFCLLIVATVVISSVWTAVSTTAVEFYIASQLKVFQVCVGPVVKSVMSKVVHLDEVSKVIAFLSSAEAFMPQITAIMYNKFYNVVVGFDPFAVYYLSALLSLTAMFSFGLCMILYRLGRWNLEEKTDIISEEKMTVEKTRDCDLNAIAKHLEANSTS